MLDFLAFFGSDGPRRKDRKNANILAASSPLFLLAYFTSSRPTAPTPPPRWFGHIYHGMWTIWSFQGDAGVADEEASGLPQPSLLSLLLHRRTRQGITVAHLNYMSPMPAALTHQTLCPHVHTTGLRGLTLGSRKTKPPKPGRARPVAASSTST
jgi:hypothetical protein